MIGRGILICMTALLWTLACVPAASAQDGGTRAATEARLQALRRQIEEDQQRLSQTAEAERATTETLDNLDRQIAARTELIASYRRRLSQLAAQSDSLRTSMSTLARDLARLKDQYRHRAIHAYKYGRMHDLALILAAKSINQMLIRVTYLHRFAEQRQERLEDIVSAGAELQARRATLQETLARNKQLLSDAQSEQQHLSRLQQDRMRVIADLRTQRVSIEKEIQRNKMAVSELEARIREIAENATTRRREAVAADPAAAAAFIEMTGTFRQNRGNLPWPAEGVVREPFGDLVNPVYGTNTPNPGILIDTQASAAVRSVFDGRVVEVSVLPHFGTYVSIEHGEYQTIYSNFSETYVAEGETVRAGQVIGRAGTDAEPRGRAIFFGLFTDRQFVDPEPWLAGR